MTVTRRSSHVLAPTRQRLTVPFLFSEVVPDKAPYTAYVFLFECTISADVPIICRLLSQWHVYEPDPYNVPVDDVRCSVNHHDERTCCEGVQCLNRIAVTAMQH